MGSDAKVLVRKKDEQTATHLAASGIKVEQAEGEWLNIGDRNESLAKALSISLGTPTVYWAIHTVVDLIDIVCYCLGAPVRRLTYSADDGGWIQNDGARQYFEGKSLKKWLRKRRISASPDGYEVLDAFLGNEPPEPVKQIKDHDANTTLYLPSPIVAEVSELAKKRKIPVGVVLTTAWELGKATVFEQRVAEDGPVELAPPSAPSVAPELLYPEAAVAPLALKETDTVKCAVVLPPETVKELQRVQGAFGHPMKWLLRDAYLIARPRLGLI